MRFQIRRTSQYCMSENSPCEEAVREKYIRIDERNVDNPKKLTYRNAYEDWIGNGRNHRVENGHIKRDFDSEDWFVYINNFDELFEFTKKYGDLVLGMSWDSDGMSLEIYDDYRE